MNRMEDKVAIVTGGARGIGRQIVETLSREGARRIYSLDMGIGEYDLPNVQQVQVNVTNRDQVAKFVEDVKNEVGKVDVLVNNAGITRDALIQKMTEDMWDAVIDVNLKGGFNLSQVEAPF